MKKIEAGRYYVRANGHSGYFAAHAVFYYSGIKSGSADDAQPSAVLERRVSSKLNSSAAAGHLFILHLRAVDLLFIMRKKTAVERQS